MEHLTEVSGPPLTDVPPSTWIFDRIEEWAKRAPERFAFALDQQDSVREYRYADVLREADAISAFLASRGLQQGDRIAILMENVPQWVFVLLGAMRSGIITVPFATTLPEDQLIRVAEHSGSRLIFSDDTNLEKAKAVAARFGIDVVSLNDWERASASKPQSAPRNVLDPESTVLLIYTSGTTGEPKGVQLTVLNLIHEIRGIFEPLEMSADHRILSVLPFSHVLPLIANALAPLCLGAGVVFLSSISPQRIIEAFHRHRITCFVCVPQFFYLLHKRIFTQVQAQPWYMRKLFEAMRSVAQRLSPSGRRRLFSKIHKTIGPDLRLLASGGSRFDSRIATDLTDLGYTVVNAYGLTETSAAVTATPIRQNRIGTVGKPLRGAKVRIDAPNQEGIGEVCIGGPLLMKGYYRADSQTASVIRGGWLYTGDLGFIDLEGNLTITGRSKDVIVLASGKNIYPEEIETQYGRSPFIKEMCVLGVSEAADARSGEKLHAVVVPDMDEFRKQGESSIMEVIRFEMESLSKSLPSYQHILSFSIRNEPLPRTVTRKLKRFEIEAEEKQRRQPGETRAAEDHVRFRSGIGQTVATLVRSVKPEAVGLDPSMNFELDLGFDSLAKVELLTEIESRTGLHVESEEAARIYTLGELIDALEQKSGSVGTSGRGWKDILTLAPSDELNQHYIFKPKPIPTGIIVTLSWICRTLSRVLFRLRWRGLENFPQSGAYLICPNHESFLDAPSLYMVLPPRVIWKTFSLGYSDYWQGTFSRRLAEACNIVAIDSNANLVRAMQAGAVGLKRNKALLIFPEGTRSIDGHIGEIKKGASILSTELGVPIVPVGINGTFEAWPRSGGFKLHPIEIVVGAPIDPRRFADAPDPYVALTNHLRNVMKTLTYDL